MVELCIVSMLYMYHVSNVWSHSRHTPFSRNLHEGNVRWVNHKNHGNYRCSSQLSLWNMFESVVRVHLCVMTNIHDPIGWLKHGNFLFKFYCCLFTMVQQEVRIGWRTSLASGKRQIITQTNPVQVRWPIYASSAKIRTNLPYVLVMIYIYI